jgi:DMSO/TMAO reductase YedYZ molybdopterin-dependent catalytic subunit
VTFQHEPPHDDPVRRTADLGRLALTLSGAAVGIVTTLVALGVAQVVAALISSPIGEPVQAVGELSIDHAPPSVKNFAIREFGSNDKTALVWGIRGVLIIFAIIIGILAVRRLWLGMLGLAVFAVIGVVAALSQPTAKASDVLPTLVGAAVGAFALRYLAGLAKRRAAVRQPGASRYGAPPYGGRPWTPPPASWSAGAAAEADGPVAASEQPDQAHEPPQPTPAQPTPAQPAAPRPMTLQPAGGPPDRRKFLLVGAAVAGISVLTYAGGSWLANTRDVNAIQQALRLPAPAKPAPPLPPGTNLNIPGLSSFITPNASFYRVDTAIILPEILPASWQLRIHGMVERELVLTFDELIKRPLIEDYITLCCVSNPVAGPYVGNAKWLGASLRSLLREAGIKAGADQLFCTSSDGFTSGTPVQTAMDGRDALLAVAMNGTALPVAHGFPVRLVIPGLYGYVSACKWIVDIEVTTYASNVSYWAQRGWDAQAPIKTESRIDVPGSSPIKAGTPTPIAGVAWAQHKGIEAVEVRVANGPWHEAKLAAVPGIDCWRQWVYDWDANIRPGSYLIEARATDKTGYTQTGLQEPPEPNGASGYPTAVANIVS